jgi:hypothetical protein
MPAEYIRKTETYLATEQAADSPLLEDFEGANIRGSVESYNGSGAITQSTARIFRGEKSALFATGATAPAIDDYETYQVVGGAIKSKRAKYIFYFSPFQASSGLWDILFEGGGISLQTGKFGQFYVTLKRTAAQTYKIYVDTDTATELVATFTGGEISSVAYNRFEIEIDIKTGKMVSVALNGVKTDVSTLNLYTFATAVIFYSPGFIRITTTTRSATTEFKCYFDDLMAVETT